MHYTLGTTRWLEAEMKWGVKTLTAIAWVAGKLVVHVLGAAIYIERRRGGCSHADGQSDRTRPTAVVTVAKPD